MSIPTARIGIDIGGTATRIALVTATDVIATTTISTPTSRNDAAQELRTAIDSLLENATRPIDGIGIGASGPIDPEGVIQNEDTLPALTGIDLPGVLGKAFQVPVIVDNDAVTAALAEYRVGAARELRRCFCSRWELVSASLSSATERSSVAATAAMLKPGTSPFRMGQRPATAAARHASSRQVHGPGCSVALWRQPE